MMLYECGVRYERTMANGITKKVTELYLVDALSFTEAEETYHQRNGAVLFGRLRCCNNQAHQLLRDCRERQGRQVVPRKASLYHARRQRPREEDRYSLHRPCTDINNAHAVVIDRLKGSMVDFEIATLDETKIMDIFRYKPNTANG